MICAGLCDLPMSSVSLPLPWGGRLLVEPSQVREVVPSSPPRIVLRDGSFYDVAMPAAEVGRLLAAARPTDGEHRRPARRTRSRLWRFTETVAVSMGIVGLLGYGALRFVPAVHQLALEEVVTTGHRHLALLFASEDEVRHALQVADGNSRVQVVRPLKIKRSSTQVAAAKPVPPYTTTPISGSTWQGWLTVIPDPTTVHVLVSNLIGRYGQQVSAMGEDAGAVATINAGGFLDINGMGNGGQATGALVSNGRYLQGPDGELVIGFTANGTLVAGHFTLQVMHQIGVEQAVSWRGPILVANGVGQITEGDGGWGYGPRTVIGQRADGTVLWLTIDGRELGSIGASMLEAQQVMLREGAVTAVALDGGASTVLWEAGKGIVNEPCSPYGQRYVPDAFAVIPRKTVAISAATR